MSRGAAGVPSDLHSHRGVGVKHRVSGATRSYGLTRLGDATLWCTPYSFSIARPASCWLPLSPSQLRPTSSA
jgi:hypothetical protein